MEHKPRYLLIIAALALLLGLALPATQTKAAEQRCFPETNQCISGRFLEYWEQNGGLAVFGYPVTAARDELNWDTGKTYLTQWFERNRFELHPENARPYDVLLGRLGDDGLRKAGISWHTEPKAGGPQAGCRWFPETQQNVCDQAGGLGFKSYWEGHGLEFDGKPGASYEESLALFGLPLTGQRMETNQSGDTVLTQWFERARVEWHPSKPTAYKVLLGLLGNESRVPLVRTRTAGLPGELLVQSGALYGVKTDGSGLKTYQNFLPLDGGVVVSPDRKKLAARCWQGGSAGICTMALDGSGVTWLTADDTATVTSWSPNGQKITYISASGNQRGLYVINVDGTGKTKLMTGSESLMPGGGSWSLDSAQIAFETNYAERSVYVVKADGTDLRKVAIQGWGPQWSPTGRRIAFVSNLAGGAPDVYTVLPDGTGTQRVTNSEETEEAVRWSPDGKKLAVLQRGTTPKAPALPVPSGVVVMQPDGTQQVLTVFSDGAYSINWFDWAPAGDYVAAQVSCARLCGPQQVWARKVDGSGTTRTIVQGERSDTAITALDWVE